MTRVALVWAVADLLACALFVTGFVTSRRPWYAGAAVVFGGLFFVWVIRP